MKLMKQPTVTSCGQTCVAMICRIEWEEACAAVGKRGKTSAKDLIKALRKYGFSVPDRLTRLNGRPIPRAPGTFILRLRYAKPSKASHWVVCHYENILDPAYGFNPTRRDGDRYTSYLPIQGAI